MTAPMPPAEPSADHGLTSMIAAQVSQILSEQGKQSVQLAHMEEQLRAVPDHEQRIRETERQLAEGRGQHDLLARVIATIAVAAAVAGVVGTYVHH